MKNSFILFTSLLTFNSSFALFHEFPAAYIYPTIIDLGNKSEIQRIFTDKCSNISSMPDVFEFSWDNANILASMNNLATNLSSFEQYKKTNSASTKNSQTKKGKLQLPQLYFDEVENFSLLNYSGISIFCNTLKQKFLSLENIISIQKKHIPSEMLTYVDDYHPLPNSYQEGFIQTKNKTGDEVSIITTYIIDFMQRVQGKRVYDIGSGFGINTQRALTQNASRVTAIDYSVEQLQAVVARAPVDKVNNLFIVNGKIPELFTEASAESADIVLLSHVLHYLTPEKAEATLAGVNKLLRKGGVFYIQALTIKAAPYTMSYDKNSVSLFYTLQEKEREYDNLVGKNFRQNYWPTYLNDIKSHTDFPMIHPQYLPALIEACKRNGFEIMQAGTYHLLDGKPSQQGDALGIIAVKK